MGEETQDGHVSVRATFKPNVTLIWLGAVVMAFGGMLSLLDRRLRIGVPKPARSRVAAVPAE
jgi:cytochrome c-type biogenesis protein CcmF